MGVAVLPQYVAHGALQAGALRPLLQGWALPVQEVHAVFSSPKLLPSKVRSLCDFLAPRFAAGWWAA
jgi:DNA-binding transcriptional LysR family regulator